MKIKPERRNQQTSWTDWSDCHFETWKLCLRDWTRKRSTGVASSRGKVKGRTFSLCFSLTLSLFFSLSLSLQYLCESLTENRERERERRILWLSPNVIRIYMMKFQPSMLCIANILMKMILSSNQITLVTNSYILCPLIKMQVWSGWFSSILSLSLSLSWTRLITILKDLTSKFGLWREGITIKFPKQRLTWPF